MSNPNPQQIVTDVQINDGVMTVLKENISTTGLIFSTDKPLSDEQRAEIQAALESAQRGGAVVLNIPGKLVVVPVVRQPQPRQPRPYQGGNPRPYQRQWESREHK